MDIHCPQFKTIFILFFINMQNNLESKNSEIYVIKRNGQKEEVHFDKVQRRIKFKSHNLSVNPTLVAQRVCSQIYNGVSTAELDELTGQICTSLMTEHPDYGILATRIVISNNHKTTPKKFSESMRELFSNNPPLVSDELKKIVEDNGDLIDMQIDNEKDYLLDYFGFKTLQKGYLLKIGNRIIERPQYMMMRVSLGLHGTDLENAFRSYRMLSQKYFSHATPTLFHSGTPRPQLLSCFLLGTEDSIDGIYKNISDCAKISKWAGGIGVHVNNIRGRNAYIRSSNGHGQGIVPMLRVYNETAKYVNQCFTPETIIFTRNGFKEIQSIIPGDEVITVTGEFKKVSDVHKNHVQKKILKIKIENAMDAVSVTKEHKIFTVSNSVTTFKYADQLKEGDFVGFPIPDVFSTEGSSQFFYIYGILLAGGSVNGTEKIVYGIKESVVDTVVSYFYEKNIEFSYMNEILKWKSSEITYDDIYNENGIKRIPRKFMNISKENIKNIIRGFCTINLLNEKDIILHSFYHDLAYDLRYLFLCLGILTDGYKLDGKDEDEIEYRDTYIIKIPKIDIVKDLLKIEFKSQNYNYIIFGRVIWTKIEEIKEIDYEGPVYDLTVNDIPSYVVANLGIVHNSGKRNGSIAIYLEPYHPDIMDFLDLRKNNGSDEMRTRDLFTALMIPDIFMRRVEYATKNPDESVKWTLFDPDACPGLSDAYGKEFDELYENYEREGKGKEVVDIGKLWKKIMSSQIETGTPYILFKDRINEMSNQSNIGTIKSSNLCVDGMTEVLTKNGFEQIFKLENKTVEIWNGFEFSEVLVNKTGENQEMQKIEFNNGEELICTPYHKFYVKDGSKIKEIRAHELQKNMKLQKFDFPILEFENNKFTFPYFNGLYSCGVFNNVKQCSLKKIEGTNYCRHHKFYEKYEKFSKNLVKNPEKCNGIIGLSDEQMEMIQIRRDYKNAIYKKTISEIEIWDVQELHTVPIYFTKEIRLNWLAGLFDGNAKVLKDSLRITSGAIAFLKNIKKLLNTLGCDCRIKGSDTIFCLTISRYYIKKLQELGLMMQRIILNDEISKQECEYIKVKSIFPKYKNADTFCFNEEKRHFGVFNRILTGQCAEIVEYSDANEYACCCLASISLGELVDEKKIDGPVKIYSKTGCPYCDKAMELLPKDCEKILLDDDNERKEFYNNFNKNLKSVECDGNSCRIVSKTGIKSVPQIFIGDKHIGGYTDLVKYLEPEINYGKLEEICEVLVRNLNKVIDLNYYPVPETARSNFRLRPLGIGVQGMADMLFKLRIPFESEEAKIVNKRVFEAIQYYCLRASCKIAEERESILNDTHIHEELVEEERDKIKYEIGGYNFTPRELGLERFRGAYAFFEGSPLSRGEFQWEKYGVEELFMGREKWEELRRDIMRFGVRNSLLVALMPTASTSQILGNNECFEPITSNIYTRRTLAGDFVVLNKYLVRDLVRDGVWNRELKDLIIAENGSIANLTFLPEKMRELYKTVWEIKQKTLIDLSADRTPFVCQTQSLNLFFEEPKVSTLGSALIYGWKRGLKTGSYYIRSRPRVQAQQFTVDPRLKEKVMQSYEVCESCSG